MSTSMYTDGNLALVLDAPRAGFSVVDGYKRTYDSSDLAQERAAASALAPKTLVIVFALAAIMIACLFGTLIAGQRAYDTGLASRQRAELVVGSGDTLWSIASEHAIEGLSTQDTVSVLREWNDLSTSSLTPGTTLVVPA